jgi:hypothetical protein
MARCAARVAARSHGRLDSGQSEAAKPPTLETIMQIAANQMYPYLQPDY